MRIPDDIDLNNNMRDKEDGDRGNSLFFTQFMIAMSVYPMRLEDPISNDAIDIELAERVSVSMMKQIISNVHPDHPSTDTILLENEDERLLPEESEEVESFLSPEF